MRPVTTIRLSLAGGYLYLALIIVLSLIPNPPDIDPTAGGFASHLSAYFLLMLWFSRLYPPRYYPRLGIGFICMGVLLEILQGQTEYRTFQYTDMVSNAVGVFIAWAIAKRGRA